MIANLLAVAMVVAFVGAPIALFLRDRERQWQLLAIVIVILMAVAAGPALKVIWPNAPSCVPPGYTGLNPVAANDCDHK